MTFPSLEQSRVISHSGNPLVVVAPPGTGKTTTIVARMIELLRENSERNVCFITFTRSSRRDTAMKVERELGKDVLKSHQFNCPRISTLHTFAKGIVHRYASLINRRSQFSVLIGDTGEDTRIILDLIEDQNLEIDSDQLRYDIAFYRQMGVWPNACKLMPADRAVTIAHYDRLLALYDTFDMDSMVDAACSVLTIRHKDMEPMFLQVDEYQDLNPRDQTLIIQVKAIPGSEVIVVGDDAQSIYGFRHANPGGIRDLWSSPEWSHIAFPCSHRLPGHIVRASQALIAKGNYIGGQAQLPDDDGKRIPILQCTTPNLQLEAISRHIKAIKMSTGNSHSYADFMVLCPTTNQVRQTARYLTEQYGIPTRLRNKERLPEDHWRLLLVLRMLEYEDSMAFRQWLSIIGIDKAFIADLRNKALATDMSFYSYCRKSAVPSLAPVFIALDEAKKALNEPSAFCRCLLAFPGLVIEESLFPQVGMTIEQVARGTIAISSIITYIQEKFGLLEMEATDVENDSVLVTTMHSAKGLEARIVYVLWLCDNYMPASNRDRNEERRVLYVAMTRAKEETILSFHERFDGRRITLNACSPFLIEISDYLAFVKVSRPKMDGAIASLI